MLRMQVALAAALSRASPGSALPPPQPPAAAVGAAAGDVNCAATRRAQQTTQFGAWGTVRRAPVPRALDELLGWSPLRNRVCWAGWGQFTIGSSIVRQHPALQSSTASRVSPLGSGLLSWVPAQLLRHVTPGGPAVTISQAQMRALTAEQVHSPLSCPSAARRSPQPPGGHGARADAQHLVERPQPGGCPGACRHQEP